LAKTGRVPYGWGRATRNHYIEAAVQSVDGQLGCSLAKKKLPDLQGQED